MYVDGSLIVNNDYAQTIATMRCRAAVAISSGLHVLYIEGWSRSSVLSMATTYQGPDTSNLIIPIAPVTNTAASAINVSTFLECDPMLSSTLDGIFTLCGFKADNNTDLKSVDDLYTYYKQVHWLTIQDPFDDSDCHYCS